MIKISTWFSNTWISIFTPSSDKMVNPHNCKKNTNNSSSIKLPNLSFIYIMPTLFTGTSNPAIYSSIKVVKLNSVILDWSGLWSNHQNNSLLSWQTTSQLDGIEHQNFFLAQKTTINKLICGLSDVLLDKCSTEKQCFLELLL